MMRLLEAAQAIGGLAVNGDADILNVSTDTRSVARGDLFIALTGEHFDGHDFVQAAFDQGAAAVMVARAWADAHPLTQATLIVDDTRLALGQLAAWWRGRFDLPLVGITGSNGKTTVKEMTAAILRAQAEADGLDAGSVLATTGNLNNDIGLPLMLLRLRDAHRAAVIEMGMNHTGEIAYLTRLAQPTVALVNNAQRAHLAGLGSVRDVARAKGEIFEGLREGGTAVINADDAYASLWRESNAGRGVQSFGLTAAADVTAQCELHALGSLLNITTPQGKLDVLLKVPGLHNARNALAATAASLAAGASLVAVQAGLAAFSGVSGRLQIRLARAAATLIDDSYNANPDSVRAAIDVLAATPGKKILVLGDMGEIGDRAGQFHDEIGGYAKSQGVDRLYALGEQSAVAARNFGPGGLHFTDVDALIAAISSDLDANTVVLVKGSRFMRMERIANALSVNGAAELGH